ncbi:hypothetical protein CYMTET_32120 [Cymbomonas tetramitiformis]|uniref:Uncharacterized protein n=1 Tax=Cymbomonas tetramitiformis TaxID=36881 RepID=A0AAE0FG17_9CHLO|nr:hypothetical protein CYMTET_32120 [Cymbomonas tetramitiformis]
MDSSPSRRRKEHEVKKLNPSVRPATADSRKKGSLQSQLRWHMVAPTPIDTNYRPKSRASETSSVQATSPSTQGKFAERQYSRPWSERPQRPHSSQGLRRSDEDRAAMEFWKQVAEPIDVGPGNLRSDALNLIHGSDAERALVKERGPLRPGMDISYIRERPLSPDGRRELGERFPMRLERSDILEQDRKAAAFRPPSNEPIYMTNGEPASFPMRDYAEKLNEGVLPDTQIPARFQLFAHSPIGANGGFGILDAGQSTTMQGGRNAPKWDKTIFPTKRPAGRWEVVQLSRVFDAMAMEANANNVGKAVGMNCSRKELCDYDPDEAVSAMWTVYQTIWLEIVRQVWVHCTERGVLLERVRKSCEMCMTYMRQMLGAYRGHLIEAVLHAEASQAEAKRLQDVEAELQSQQKRNNELDARMQEMEDLYKNAVREGKIKDDMIKEYKERADWTEQRNSALQRQVTMMESEVKEMEMRMKMAEEDVLQSTNNQNRRAEALQGALHDDAKELEEVKLRMQEMEKESEQPWSLITLLVSEDDLGSREKIGTSAEKAALLLHDLPLHNLTTVFTRLPAFNISKLLLAQENPGYFPDALATVVKTDPNTITLALAMVAAQKPTIFNKLINRMGMDCMEELCVGLKSVTSGQFQVFLDNIINSEFRCAEASAWREGISRGNDVRASRGATT